MKKFLLICVIHVQFCGFSTDIYSEYPIGMVVFFVTRKIFFKSLLKKNLKEIGDFDSKLTPLLFTEHHIGHAASAFYPSGFEDAAILVVDGVGEWATITISRGEGKKIEILKPYFYYPI
mgnify:CR=1 FL=1